MTHLLDDQFHNAILPSSTPRWKYYFFFAAVISTSHWLFVGLEYFNIIKFLPIVEPFGLLWIFIVIMAASALNWLVLRWHIILAILIALLSLLATGFVVAVLLSAFDIERMNLNFNLQMFRYALLNGSVLVVFSVITEIAYQIKNGRKR